LDWRRKPRLLQRKPTIWTSKGWAYLKLGFGLEIKLERVGISFHFNWTLKTKFILAYPKIPNYYFSRIFIGYNHQWIRVKIDDQEIRLGTVEIQACGVPSDGATTFLMEL